MPPQGRVHIFVHICTVITYPSRGTKPMTPNAVLGRCDCLGRPTQGNDDSRALHHVPRTPPSNIMRLHSHVTWVQMTPYFESLIIIMCLPHPPNSISLLPAPSLSSSRSRGVLLTTATAYQYQVMAGHHLSLAKATFAASLFRPDVTKVTRDDLAQFHSALEVACAQCSHGNIQV